MGNAKVLNVDGKKTSIINPVFIEEIRKIILFDYVNINELIKKMDEIINEAPALAAPAA